MRQFFAAGMALALLLPAAVEPSPAVRAAIFIRSNIEFAVEMLQQCGEVDPPNIAQYLLLTIDYHKATESLEYRINEIIGVESDRAKTDFFRLLGAEHAEVEKAVTSVRSKDTRQFISTCQGLHLLAQRKGSIFKPLSERFPEQMQLVDGWR